MSDRIPESLPRQTRSNNDLNEEVKADVELEDLVSKAEKAVNIISTESGIDKRELTDETSFVSIGVDSLLSLIITSRLRDEIGFDIGSMASIFDDFSTIGELKVGLARSLGVNPDNIGDIAASEAQRARGVNRSAISSASSTKESNYPTVLSNNGSENLTSAKADQVANVGSSILTTAHPCTSVILQNKAFPDGITLFLFPDGSGSPSSYARIPRVREDLALVGLISPYSRDSAAMAACTLDRLIASYLYEIRRQQPTGPYSLGGWSTGGVLAFAATTQLLQTGEQIAHLVLIDAPPPTHGLDRLPDAFYEHCARSGVFSQMETETLNGPPVPNGSSQQVQKQLSNRLIPHFKGTVELLHNHVPAHCYCIQAATLRMTRSQGRSSSWPNAQHSMSLRPN